MNTNYTILNKDLYIERRRILKKMVGSGLILLPGHDESPINFADNAYPFRQDSSFLYLFGHNRPGLTAIVDIDEDRDYIFGPELGIDDMVWTGWQPPVSDIAAAVGAEGHGTESELKSLIEKAKKSAKGIHFLPPYRAESREKLMRWLDSDISGNADSKSSKSPSTQLIKAIVSLREIKSELELAQIEAAINISVDMHIAAITSAKAGMREEQVLAEVYREIMKHGYPNGGSVSMAFPPIATTRGETLHNHYHGNTLKSGDMFLLDSGVESMMHYASDLSSTFPVNRSFSSVQKDIYEITLSAHEAAIAALKPGIRFKDVHLCACRTISSGLKSLGIMNGDIDEAVQAGAHALFFPCGTGHMMGLDVHDMEDLGEEYVGYDGKTKSSQFGLKSLRLGKELKPGFVLTIEPGIYFIPALIEKWRSEKMFEEFINYDALEPYMKFGGIRNEEDYVITETGAELLGKPKPKRVAEIEDLRG